jgi:hypothetical protein
MKRPAFNEQNTVRIVNIGGQVREVLRSRFSSWSKARRPANSNANGNNVDHGHSRPVVTIDAGNPDGDSKRDIAQKAGPAHSNHAANYGTISSSNNVDYYTCVTSVRST